MNHITKDGRKIALKDLEDSHLQNIIRMIERKAKAGITVQYGGGFGGDDMWCDEEELSGEKALKHMDYYEYVAELNRRIKSTINF